jgi:hypothetical protein
VVSDALVDEFAGRGDLDPGRPQVTGVGQPADQAVLVEDPDDPRQHGRVEPLQLGQLGQAERPAPPDQAEHRVLRGRQALTGGRVVELAGEPADDATQARHEFGVHRVPALPYSPTGLLANWPN